jgi:mannose-6-phosphate isomerase-like protein (cupin superfamily)
MKELRRRVDNREKNAGAQTAAVSNTDQYRINVVHRTQAGAPLTHAGNTELHHIIEGAPTVVTGGTVMRSPSGATVEGGVSRHVTKGDVILVPADTPHWYKDVEGSITYLEVRFGVPAK